MTSVLISIVIPTYQRPLLLAKCLSAISRQSLNKSLFEVIVVSDGPDQLSADITTQLLSGQLNYQFLSLSGKKGPAAARNLGWQHAVGKLVAFTDDDCLPDKNWLSAISKAYSGEALAAFTGTVEVPLPANVTDYARNTAGLEGASFITANCFVSKAALELTGGFDERYSMAWREDSDLEFKLISYSVPITKIKSALVVHPVREAAWGTSIKEQKKGIFNALLYKKFPELYRAKIQSSPTWNYYLIVFSFILAIIALLSDEVYIAVVFGILWCVLVSSFVQKRLNGNSRSFTHVTEMVITSLVIPFLSIFWQLYGAIRFRVFFL